MEIEKLRKKLAQIAEEAITNHEEIYGYIFIEVIRDKFGKIIDLKGKVQ